MGLGAVVAVKGAPDQALSNAMRVDVCERLGEATSYRIRYAVDVGGGDLPILADKKLGPGSELAILAPDGHTMHCLVKGPVHAHEVHLIHGGGSYVDVVGADRTVAMDREAKSKVWPNLTDSDAATQILVGYQFIPDVQSTTARHIEAKHVLVQRGSDLQFVRRLARRNGFLFWISCNSLAIETAHFKRPPLGGTPSADVVVNLANPTTDALDIYWDVERPTSVASKQLDLGTKTDIVGNVAKTPQTILGAQSLSAITQDTRSVFVSAPADDAGALKARAEGTLVDADWFVRASFRTSLAQSGTVLRAHSLVRVRGAGSRHDGSYLVAAVDHGIDASAHTMNVTLLRNGWSN